MTRLVAAALAISCLAAASPAHAQEPLWRRWYGWQLVAADVAAGALVLAPIDDGARGATTGIGMTALFMNGSIVHMANRNPRSASLSLLRLPAFLFGRLAGFGLGHALCQQTGCKGPAQFWGGAIGLGGAVLFDWVTALRPQPGLWAQDDGARPDDAAWPVLRPRAPEPARPLPVAGPAFGVPIAAGTF